MSDVNTVKSGLSENARSLWTMGRHETRTASRWMNQEELIVPTATRDRVTEDGLMTVPEAVEFLKLSRARLYVLMSTGALAYVQLGRHRRIPRRSVIALAEGPRPERTQR